MELATLPFADYLEILGATISQSPSRFLLDIRLMSKKPETPEEWLLKFATKLYIEQKTNYRHSKTPAYLIFPEKQKLRSLRASYGSDCVAKPSDSVT